MRLVAVLLAWLALVLPALAQPVPVETVIRNAVEDVIRPGFVQLHEEAISLEANMARLCFEHSPEALETAQNQFRSLVTAYSRIEFVRFGPLSEENRLERLFFWPDRRGIGLRQVQGILAEADESATDEATLREKSVAVQGLGALEFVLFGTGSEALVTTEGDFRCRYGHAVAAALKTTARELAEAWTDEADIAFRMLYPNPDASDFRSEREVLEALTGALAYGIEAVRDTRLLPFLGREGQDPNPRAAAFWRSGMTLPSLRANFEGLRQLFELSGIGRAMAEENAWVANSTLFEFGNALRAAETVTSPVEEALADEGQRRALHYLVILTQSLQALVGENLAAALGLSVGFSSLDGD